MLSVVKHWSDPSGHERMFDMLPAASAGILGSRTCILLLCERLSKTCLYMYQAPQLVKVLPNAEGNNKPC